MIFHYVPWIYPRMSMDINAKLIDDINPFHLHKSSNLVHGMIHTLYSSSNPDCHRYSNFTFIEHFLMMHGVHSFGQHLCSRVKSTICRIAPNNKSRTFLNLIFNNVPVVLLLADIVPSTAKTCPAWMDIVF